MNSSQTCTERAAPLRGLFPPVLLPLDERGEIDFTSLDNHLGYLLSGPVDGLWVNGTTGDFFALTDQEQVEVLGAIVARVQGRIPIVAHIGDTVTRKVIRNGEQALEAGAEHLSVILPYFVPYSTDELIEHYRLVSRALQRPLILYHYPQMSKVSLTVPDIIELAREGVVHAIKESSSNQDFYRLLIEAAREESVTLRCFVGAGSLMDVSLLAGGDGLMCLIANLIPATCQQLYRHARAGQWEEARQLQSRVIRLASALRLPHRNNWATTIATYKWALRELGIIASDSVFAPLQALSTADQAVLRERALPLLENMVGRSLSAKDAPTRPQPALSQP